MGFVHHEQVWLADESAGDEGTLLLAGGEVADTSVLVARHVNHPQHAIHFDAVLSTPERER